MGSTDWTGIPLEGFFEAYEVDENGRTTGRRSYPHGDGAAPSLMVRLAGLVESAYEDLLLSEEDGERYERTGEVLVIRDGRRTYEALDGLTLRDLPAVLDTLTVLEEEAKSWGAEKRKARRRELDRERRKRKRLGEW